MKGKVSHTGRRAGPGNRKILVAANEIIEGQTFRQATGLQVGDEQRAGLRAIAPALNSRFRHWGTAEDEARRSAARRLAPGPERLSAAGTEADMKVPVYRIGPLDCEPIEANG